MSYSRDNSTEQKRQMSETISYIIPENTKNEVNVPPEAKTDHDDNSLQGGIDDFVSLSVSRAEIMLEEINTYESSQEKSFNDMVLTDISNTVSSTCSQKCEKKIVHRKVCERTMIFNNCSINLYYNNQQ